MPKKLPFGRSLKDVRAQYEFEKELANRLRSASPAERRVLYSTVYDELFSRCPDHPQLVRKHDPKVQAAQVAMHMLILRHFLRQNHTYLEIGPGDCSLTLEVARHVRRCFAVDVSTEITHKADWPANMELFISDGSSIPVPAGSVDLAYSNQLMEHLHPDDARGQLANIHAALRPGGRYVCRTPNRLSGPHDISGPFDVEATGFHLREYTIGELVALFRSVGFTKFGGFVLVRGGYHSHPLALVLPIEAVLKLLPRQSCQNIATTRLLGILLGVNLVATK